MDDFVLETREGDKHASALVAPLNIQKSPKKTKSRELGHIRQSSSRGAPSVRSQSHSHSHSHPSPPLTPKISRESLPEPEDVQPVFHNYLRAFYHFHPSATVSSSSTDESSVTVPISQGDVILVHSVHPNGWADGTLLASGARGWLPTNYCEAYDHPSIRNLLNALTHLWDLVRDGENGDVAVFTKQDYVRGMIAGVRYFLERTQCLTRESPLVVAHIGLRRMRKGLLGDLSSLVKTAKKLQEALQTNDTSVPVFDYLDELVLKAFKLVTRAVRFHDIWEEDSVSRTFDLNDTRNNRPPTPPSDSVDPSVQPHAAVKQYGADDVSANEEAASATQTNTAGAHEEDSTVSQPPRTINRLSVAFSIPPESDSHQSPPLHPLPQGQAKRLSVTHRLSHTGKSQGGRKQNLASERLNAAHDSFLGFIGSFIGLHLQSRSSDELTFTTQQSVIACRQLLAVVDEIWERDSRRSEQLEQARDSMYARLTELVQATKELFGTSSMDEEMVMPDSGQEVVSAATSCVRSAGDCVTKSRSVIERIGDFEFETVGLGLSDVLFEQIDQITEKYAEPLEAPKQPEPAMETDKPLPAPPTEPRHPASLIIAETKPLPDVPLPSPLESNRVSLQAVQPAIVESPVAVSSRSSRSSLPPLTHFPTPHIPQPSPSEFSQSPASATRRFFSKATRSDSVNASMVDSSSAYRLSMRGETASVISQASTRATTPDHSSLKAQSSQTLVSSFGSSSELHSIASDDVAAAEEHLLETSYAHELIYNKEGQISGGSLPALVEQLTTHVSTPDVMFVKTFYMTFRLFTTPVELAQCLIARFDYIGDNHSVGVPVRIRIYKVFKVWLETYWLAESDSAAIGIILAFATGKLRAALPSAGKRLAELTSKVTEVHAGALVPRPVPVPLVGQSGVSSILFAQADSNVPAPNITKSQLSALRSAKEGKSKCSILDFDPLELARQYTLIVAKVFCGLRPEEFLALEWTKKNSPKAANVRAMATLSNDLGDLVADSILQYEDAKKRAVVIKQWIKISTKCLELSNYASLMAIIVCLSSSVVSRLNKTWEMVSAKTKARFEEMKAIIDHRPNYPVLRQRLLQNPVGPCIPFLGYYLTDLTFIDAGNGNTRKLPGTGEEDVSVINFNKHMRTADVISQIQAFQVPYRLQAIPEMQEWIESQFQRIHSIGQQDNLAYYRRSCILESRPPPKATKPSPPLPDSCAQSTAPTENRKFSAESRNSSKERFEFLNFSFSTSNILKDPHKDR